MDFSPTTPIAVRTESAIQAPSTPHMTPVRGQSNVQAFTSPLQQGREFTNISLASPMKGSSSAALLAAYQPSVSVEPRSTPHVSLSSLAVVNSMELLAACPLPFGLTLTPMAEGKLDALPEITSDQTGSCSTCGLLANLYSRPNHEGTAKCALCGTSQQLAQRHITSHGGEPGQQYSDNGYIVDVTDSTLTNTVTVEFCFVVDMNDIKSNFTALIDGIKSLVDGLPDHCTLHLLTFKRTIEHHFIFDEYYEEEELHVACHCVSGKEEPSNQDLQYLFEDESRPLTTDYQRMNTVESCRRGLLDALEAIRQGLPDEPLSPFSSAPPIRCTGAATSVGLALLERSRLRFQREHKDDPGTRLISKLIVYSTGESNLGPGSLSEEGDGDIFAISSDKSDEQERKCLEFYQTLSRRAHTCGTAIYSFCCGSANFNAPSFASLFATCEGETLLFSSLASANESRRFARCLALLATRTRGIDSTLTVLHPSALRLTRLVGPLIPKEEDRKTSAASVSSPYQNTTVHPKKHHSISSTALTLTSNRIGDSLAFFYTLNDDLPGNYVHFQFILDYTEVQDFTFLRRKRRVWTVCVSTTGSFQRLVRSFQVNTLSCLLIKHAILVSQEKDRQTAVRLVADTLKEVSVKFGTKGQRAKPADSALKTTRSSLVTYTVPQNIEQLPLVLYHLAKGPLLGDLVASYDDRVVEGALVLRSGVEACVRLALPTLLSFNSAGDLKQLPLITLSLDSNRILFMDCHSHILVWSGLNVTHASYDVFRDVCLSRALVSSQSRLPQPIVLCFNEGDSNARWLSSRLSPAHQDPSYLHPSLQGLSIQAIQALCGKFTPTDQPSYHQFMATLFN